MASLSQELKRWAVEELELPVARLPDDGYIKTLCVGPGASIWKYITQHVYKERNVRVMRGNIQWYKVLQDKELKQLKNQNKDARRLELRREIAALQTELNQLDTKISRVEDQIATEEQNINRNWDDFMDGRHRQILLDSFRQRCSEERNILLEDTHMIGTQRHTLEELSKKAEVKLVFGPSDSSDSEAGADPLVLKDVRELCSERVLFFQCLLESELNVNPSTEFTHEQRKAVIQHWTSAVENVLRSHPPNQVLSALQVLTSRQQVVLKEKIAALNVERDISDLGFRYQSDHLIDVSADQEEELTPVRSLLQSAWEEVEQSYFELAQVHNRCGQLETELTALMRKAETAHGSDPVSRCVFELEMEGVKQAAVRDSIREQCAQLQLQAREGLDAIRTLQTQWQSVMDFRQLVDSRQEQIRRLIKGNSTVKTELTCVHAEVGQFVQEKLNAQFCNVIKASSGLVNSVSQGAKHFSCVALAALDRRVMKGRGQKPPAAQLSIHWIQSPAFHKLCESLSFPLYMAPEELWSQATTLRLELRNLRRLLQLFSESSADLQKLTAQLPSPDQQTLVQRVKMVDEEILQTLLPRARELTQRCSKGLLYTEQVKTAITHWWEQPGQFALPEMQREGLTFQQWLQRWKLATKES
ncbi:HAUS augmin-like complex subunit 5 isoform X1 [Sinocyclocheilus rhinocerous]|uniref:HAUS augmin-like complex subunit 5 isoform X1 n=1 Tax=Sinocyclocheilus rhinocerous TaxID=307959 RepID=UPI0007B9BE33|nr:PREDICTED: HAUS augmin-like complex subunit 5 isoform X1 [Sinocyclocheilus rhinocerous]